MMMDTLDVIASLLARRDSLLDSLQYASPEEARVIDRDIKRLMRRVFLLLGLVDWVES